MLGVSETLHVYTDRSEAMKIMKKHKKARFKSFKLREEAVEFAVQGPETVVISSSGLTENLEAASGIVGEKPSPFKGPKAQDLVRLRKAIECGDIGTFTGTVWDNPRYLVSSGDTPAILQVGSLLACVTIFEMYVLIQGDILNTAILTNFIELFCYLCVQGKEFGHGFV